MADEEVDYGEDDARVNNGKSSSKKNRIKGRGIARMDDDRYEGRGGVFETIAQNSQEGPAQCTLSLTYVF